MRQALTGNPRLSTPLALSDALGVEPTVLLPPRGRR